MIAIDLSKQQAPRCRSKNELINFTGNLEHAENTTMFFIRKEVKYTILDISLGTVKVLYTSSRNFIWY